MLLTTLNGHSHPTCKNSLVYVKIGTWLFLAWLVGFISCHLGLPNEFQQRKGKLNCFWSWYMACLNFCLFCQWLIAQLVERSLSVMKDPDSNIGVDICSFLYWSMIFLIVKLMSINCQTIYVDFWLKLEPIDRMTKTFNRTMYAERDHLKNCLTCIVFVIQPVGMA
jgi:hypothetical protein